MMEKSPINLPRFMCVGEDCQQKTVCALLFLNFGPYHRARYSACTSLAERGIQVVGLEIAAQQREYAWESHSGDNSRPVISIHKKQDLEAIPPAELIKDVLVALQKLNAEVLAIAGYSHPGMVAAMHWAIHNSRPVVMMSDSKADDAPRHAWREAIKRKLVAMSSAGLVAGSLHVDYLAGLGMARERIFLGYDAVDNDYFASKAAEIGGQRNEARKKHGLPEKYFLVSARFIAEKNLPRLLEAYALYREKAESGKRKAEIWSLVLLGDGPLRPELERLISDLRLQSSISLPGFKQYPDLPAYYGCASAFILPSVKDTWGLAVNEAMASGLPVLVSNRCGCAPDLVQDGVNGFTFDPYDVEQLADLMLKISDFRFPISDFGAASQRIIAHWGPERFADGLRQAVDCALRVGPVRPTLMQKLILRALLAR